MESLVTLFREIVEETGFSKSESGEWAVVPPSLRKKLMEGATPPNLYYEDVDGDPDKLVIHYESERGLCALMEGLLDGVSEHFGVEVGYEQTACTHQGAERCTFALEFQQAAKV